jgi:hypothetical protein
MSIPNVPVLFTMDTVSSQPAVDRDQHDVIHLGGESAVVLPLYEYRRLRALESRASAEDLDAAEADARAARRPQVRIDRVDRVI